MPDFQQILARLRPDELQLLLPAAVAHAVPRAPATRTTAPTGAKAINRRTRRSEAERDATPTEPATVAGNNIAATAPSPSPMTSTARHPRSRSPKICFKDTGSKGPPASPAPAEGREEAKNDLLVALSTQPHPLPGYQPKSKPGIAETPSTASASKSTESASAPAIPPPTSKSPLPPSTMATPVAMPTASAKAASVPLGTTVPSRRRQSVEHVWPPTGTILSANYFGTIYRAEIVPARKKLKSGKQVRLLDGPAKGKRLDSLSAAMLAATAKQRKQMNLARKGVASGWMFWKKLS